MNSMKKSTLYLALAVLAVCGCAKDPVSGLNDSAKLFFDSWIHVYHPDAPRTELGAYVLSDMPGTGSQAGTAETSPFVRVDYVITDLEGSVNSTSLESLKKQLGEYKFGDYYGPVIWSRANNGLAVGLDEAVSSMRVGGTRTLAMPGWLQTSTRRASEKDYLANDSGKPMIYSIMLRETISDIKKWETDSIGRYISARFPGKGVRDSLKYGYYYFRTEDPTEEKPFSSDTTIYINYTGRLLNGTVFDTNIRDTAKFYGIYSDSRTYAPSSVTITRGDNNVANVQMGSNSVITGFGDAIAQMHPYEKGVTVFYSTLGYGTSGSGSTIPGYSPLRFDIEIVDKEQ